MKKIRWGIIGPGHIANRFADGLKESNSGRLIAIASNNEDRRKKFGDKYSIDLSLRFSNYDEIINCNEVDAIYISTPHTFHAEWTIKAAGKGKHVLCEKSSTISYESAKKMVKTSKENNIRILEGFAFRFHPQHEQVRQLICKEIGEPHNFYGIYGFPPPPEDNIRWKKELGGGVLNDVSCYPIYASRLVLQSEPISVLSHLEFDKKFDVDKSVDIILKYPNEKTAFVSSGFNNYYQSKYSVWGSKAKISTKRAYAVPRDYKTSVYLHKNDKIFETTIPPADQFAIMFDTFCNVITNNTKNPYDFENDLLEQAKLMESIRISSREKRLVFISEIN